MDNAVLAQIHALDDGGGRHHGDDDIALLGEMLGGFCDFSSGVLLEEARGGGGDRVVDVERVGIYFANEVLGHGEAHHAQADKADLGRAGGKRAVDAKHSGKGSHSSSHCTIYYP